MLRVMAEVALTLHTFVQPPPEICFAKNEKYAGEKYKIQDTDAQIFRWKKSDRHLEVGGGGTQR